MLQRARKHINPATILAFVALIFALTGGAFAATGAGSSHATLTASAAKKSKKKAAAKGTPGPRGPAGSAGAAGPVGKAGANGTSGTSGSSGESVSVSPITPAEKACNRLGGSKFNVGGKEATACNGEAGENGIEGEKGEKGAAGESVTNNALAAGNGSTHCEEGGTEFKVGATATYACNGSPWTDGGKLPSGATETGTWAYQVAPGTRDVRFPISFSIQLSEALSAASENSGQVQIVPRLVQEGKIGAGEGELCEGKSGEELEHCQAPYALTPQDCPSTTFKEPTAKPGYLCVYENGELSGLETPIYGGVKYPQIDFEQSTVAGVVVILPESEAKEGEQGQGTWAVTAE